MIDIDDIRIEKELGLALTERAKLLEVWHSMFDERLKISHGDYEHAIEMADYYMWRAKEPKRENYGKCTCNPISIGECRDCELFAEAHFWWEDSNPNVPRGL